MAAMRGMYLFLPAVALAMHGAGPKGKVKDQIQALQDKLAEEADEDQKAFDRLGCWCETNINDKAQTVDGMRSDLNRLGYEIESKSSENARNEMDFDKHKKDYSRNQQSLDTVNSLRSREMEKFQDDEAVQSQSVDSLDGALGMLKRSHGHEIDLAAIKKSTSKLYANSTKAKALLVQFKSKLGSTTSTSPDMLYGIIKEMKSTFHEDLEGMRKHEKRSIQQHEDLASAKEKEVNIIKDQMMDVQGRVATGKQDVARKNDQKTRAGKLVDANVELLIAMKAMCKSNEGSFSARQSERQDQIVDLSKAQVELTKTYLLTLSRSLRSKQIPDSGSGARELCHVALEITEREWRSKAKDACDKAKAGKTQEATDVVESLEDDLKEAKEKAVTNRDECTMAGHKADAEAKDAEGSESVRGDYIASQKSNADSEIAALTAQGTGAGKAMSSLSEAHSAQHNVMQKIRFTSNNGVSMMQKAQGAAGGPASAKIGDAISQSKKLSDSAAAFDAQSSEDVQKLSDLFKGVQKNSQKALIPMRLMRADAMEAAVGVKQETRHREASAGPGCDADALNAKVTKINKYLEQLGEASNTVAYETLR